MSDSAAAPARPQHVSVLFNGPAVSSGGIDIVLLAPSLLALRELFAIGHGEVGAGLTLAPTLKISSTDEAAFALNLTIETIDEHSLTSALSPPTHDDDLATVVITSIEWLTTRARNNDEATLDPPVGVESVAGRLDFQRAARRFFEPLRSDGIDSIEVRGGFDALTRRSTRVEYDDLRAFNPPPEADIVLSEITRTVTVGIANVALKTDNKWRLNDGTQIFWATLDDESFRREMNSGAERFGVADRLRVVLRERQLRTAQNGITIEHSIQQVLEHRSIAPADELPFDNPPPPTPVAV